MIAAFVVAPSRRGLIAATTRAADRGEAGRIGLPGGKVEPGEAPLAAALREAAEEGWEMVRPHPQPIHAAVVDGCWVLWYVAARARRLERYKEAGRIVPIELSVPELLCSGYGNEGLPRALLETLVRI